MPTKKLILNQIAIKKLQDSFSIPTKIRYQTGSYGSNKVVIGYEAEKKVNNPNSIIENFKIELGKVSYTSNLTKTRVAPGLSRSTIGISKDFLSEVCKQAGLIPLGQQTESFDGNKTKNIANKVLVAEPFPLDKEEQDHNRESRDWFQNYRKNIKVCLQDYFPADAIDFLPEPFAVFSYYKYGIQVPELSYNQKQTALVFDFGGGTFDIAIIETTKKGDIASGGKLAKVLAPRSVAVGGFAVNKEVAREILLRHLQEDYDKKEASKILMEISSFESLTDEKIEKFDQKKKNFINNFKPFLSEVEKAKVDICNSIDDWSLDTKTPNSEEILISVPTEPFKPKSNKKEYYLKAKDLKHIFTNNIWRDKLLPEIKPILTNSKKIMGTETISVVLLSGGSCKIEWLRKLIERDLSNSLSGAHIIDIKEDYQQIVAKGLAIHASRKYHTTPEHLKGAPESKFDGDGDFGATIYNSLNLYLEPNGKKQEFKKFIPVSAIKDLEPSPSKGTIIESSSSLRFLFDNVGTWKTSLTAPPTQKLKYKFLKDINDDIEDTKNFYNIDDIIYTPKNYKFSGSNIHVELELSEDGTVTPSFIYGKGQSKDGSREKRLEGQKFALEATNIPALSTVKSSNNNEAVIEKNQPDYEVNHPEFICLDFGTGTLAIASNINENKVITIEKSSKQIPLIDLNDMVNTLPAPIALSLNEYLALRPEENNLKCDFFVQSFERMLALILSINCSELFESVGLPEMESFNISAQFTWEKIKLFCRNNISNSTISKKISECLNSDKIDLIDGVVKSVENGQIKTFKDSDFVNWLVELGSIINDSLDDYEFGNFKGHEEFNLFEGTFHPFLGTIIEQSPKFIVSSSENFSPGEIFLMSKTNQRAINISPFFFWDLDKDQECRLSVFADFSEENFSFINVLSNKKIELLEKRKKGFQNFAYSFFKKNKKTIVSDLEVKEKNQPQKIDFPNDEDDYLEYKSTFQTAYPKPEFFEDPKSPKPWYLIDKDKNGKEKRKHLSATKQEAHRSLIKEIKHSCLKTIVAFLNADGGQLVIGVYENKELQINEVIGIEEDAKDQTKEKKEFYSPDEYKRLITSNIENRINYGKKLLGDLIHVYCEKKSNGKTVCIVDVKPFFPRIGETLVCLKPEQGNKVRPEDRKEDEIYKRRTNKSEKLNIEEAQYLLQKRTFKN